MTGSLGNHLIHQEKEEGLHWCVHPSKERKKRRGVTLVCSSGYAATDTWTTRKLRTAQLRLSLLRLNPKKKAPVCEV
jgi:hypothetical protein